MKTTTTMLDVVMAFLLLCQQTETNTRSALTGAPIAIDWSGK